MDSASDQQSLEWLSCAQCKLSLVGVHRMLLCGHVLCETCLTKTNIVVTCPIDKKVDPRTWEELYPLPQYVDPSSVQSQSLSQDRTRLLEMIQYLTESIARTEAKRTEVLDAIESNTEFQHRALADREDTLQRIIVSEMQSNLETVVKGVSGVTVMSTKVDFQGPLLQEFFPNSGKVGPWNHVQDDACDEFSNVTYLLIPQCCKKRYCCYTCHDHRENHRWKNALRTICLFCDKEQDYQPLPNDCPNCKAYHSAMNNKRKKT